MTSPGGFTERLMLAVEATDRGAEATFLRLSGAADKTGRSARDAGEAVARAADRVQQARLKEADAADAVRLAAQRLQDVNERATSSESQRLAAQQRLEQAQRRQAVASREVERATEQQTAAMREAETATEHTADASRRAGIDFGELAKKGAAFAGGFEIGSWAKDALTGFLETARGAQQLSASMNATVEQGGQLAQLFGSLGLEANDLLEIQAEFAQKIEADAGALSSFGAQVERNADGTVNWATTLRGTLTALQDIPDATERNRTGFKLFGEEGYKQLSTLLTSGRSLDEVFEAIGTPVTEDDLRAVQEFDGAMLDLNLSSGELGRTLGRAVIPLVTGLVDAGQTLADVIGTVPGPVAASAGASLLLGIAMRRAATEGTFLSGVMTRLAAVQTLYTGAATRAAGAQAVASAAMARGRAAAGALSGALGGPVGIALIGVGVGVAVVNSAVETFEKRARDSAVASEIARQKFGDMAASSKELGQELVESGGATDNWVASVRGANTAVDALTEGTVADVGIFEGFASGILGAADSVFDLGLAEAGAADEIDNQREALGAAGLEAEAAQIATKGLSDLIAEGTTSGQEFADAVRTTAEAQNEQSRTTDLAKASIDAYNAITRDAVETTLALARAQLGQRSGLIDVQEALYELGDVVDDTKTPWNEVAAATDDAIGTALDYADAAADAAVEAARSAGEILTPLAEARIRGEENIRALYEVLQQPGITDSARKQVSDLIHDLQAAQDAGDVEAILKLTGAAETTGEIDEATEDRETEVRVETRNGPAVLRYLEQITDAKRLALIRVESRNGPAVAAYLDGLARERLAIIRVETRGGPAVDRYLDSLSRDRGAAIVPRVGSGMAGAPGVGSAVGYGGGAPAVRLATVDLDLRLTGSIDRSQAARAERGRAIVDDVRAYEQRSGTGWRRT